jgi:hypothetical protein
MKERCYQEEAISRHGGWKEGCGVEVTGSVHQYSLMSDRDISPIENIMARYRFISAAVLLAHFLNLEHLLRLEFFRKYCSAYRLVSVAISSKSSLSTKILK